MDTMQLRHAVHPVHARKLTTDELREEFLIEHLFESGKALLTYSHVDRAIVGGVVPLQPIELVVGPSLTGTAFLLERREMGVINIGGAGTVSVDEKSYDLARLDGLYIGKGSRDIRFASRDASTPAQFYVLSGPAHEQLPTVLVTQERARKEYLGTDRESNKRTLYQIIHPEVVRSCNVVMGYTRLEAGSVWNTMPCHTHVRRMEVYCYFDVLPGSVVFHLMGEPSETRHIVVRDRQAVISPSWSIHSGVGTANYSFIWGMLGENQTFTDMDAVPIDMLR